MNKKRPTVSLVTAANQKKKEKAYWLSQLSDHPVKCSFPFDYEGGNSVPYRIENIHFSFPDGIHRRLIDLSKGRNERLFILLVTGIFILLRKYSGIKDILLGIPVSLPKKDVSFLNSALVIRCPVEDRFTFRQLLSKTRQIVIEAVNHQNFPAEVLPTLLKMPWSPGESFPLFDVVVSLRNIHHRSLQEFAPNIMVSFERNGKGVEGIMSYNTSRYKSSTIERLIILYRRLMEDVLRNLDKDIFTIDLLSEEEKQQILVSFNDTSQNFPASTAVHQLVDRQAELIPHEIAVVYKERQLSYAELKKKSDHMGKTLRQFGVKAGHIAAVLVGHSPGMVVTLIGIMKAGGTYLPIDPDFPEGRVEYIILDSNAQYIITTRKYKPKAGDCQDKVLLYSELMNRTSRRGPTTGEVGHHHHPGHLAYIIYTSGSTGVPKGVMIEHKSFIDFTTWAVDAFEHCRGYQVLLSNSYASDGAIQQVFPPLVSGGTLHLIDKELRLDMVHYMEYLKKNKINNIDEVPLLMNELVGQIDADDRQEKLPDLTCLCLGSESVPIELVRKCRKHLNHSGRIINAYGPAEASVEATFYYFDGNSDSEISLIGKPRRNTRVYILDEAGRHCPIGMKGEICISGIGLARGYLNRPEFTAEKFKRAVISHSSLVISSSKRLSKSTNDSSSSLSPNDQCPMTNDRLYKTGDLGRWLPDGNIEFLGRIDRQIKVRGYRVELSEIEHVLRRHEGIKDAVVVTEERENGETEMCAYYVDGSRRRPVIWPSLGEYPLYDDYIYFAMSADEGRNKAYEAAIRQKAAGKVVVEIGTGKDVILARFCVAAGARKIYAIEVSEDSYKKAQQTVEELGLREKIVLIHGNAVDVDIPEKADICLSEVIGTIGGSEGAAAILNNARKFLKDDGVMIPERCITKIAAVQLPQTIHESPAFSRVSSQYVDILYRYSGHPFDFRVCIDNFPGTNVISNAGIFEDLDFSRQLKTEGQNNVDLVISEDVRMDGFLLWLNLYTTAGNVIDNLENRHCWAPVFIPVLYPGVTLSVGDKIRLTCSRSLSRNGVNPDYKLEGSITKKDGTSIPIRYDLPYFETAFLENPFYGKLLVDTPGPEGYIRHIYEDSGVSRLRQYLEERLPSYMVPSRLRELEKIPMTPSGKLDKKALPERVGALMEGYVPPRNDLEKKLAAVWAEVLDLDPEAVGVHTDFFKSGGHSLKAVILASRIQKQLNVHMPITQVFKTPSISRLAEYLKVAKKDEYVSMVPIESKEYYDLNPIQKRLYILQQIDPSSTAYNVPMQITLNNHIAKDRLEEIVKKLIDRHEILRTSFTIINGEPGQRIHEQVPFEMEALVGAEHHFKHEKRERNESSLARRFIRPFDLSQAPLLRVGLMETEKEKQVLVVDIHHIICDPISHEVLETEFRELCDGRELPVLGLHYKDYAGWQNSEAQKIKVNQQESYWLRLFDDDFPILELPTDFIRPQMQSFEGASTDFLLEEEELRPLKRMAIDNNATLFMVILAILNVLLSKLSGQEDIIMGIPISTRTHEDTEKMIGMFVNTLVMRNYPVGQKTFTGFLQEVKTQTLETYKNQDYPFEELVEKISVKRDTSRNPIFDVIFNHLKQADFSAETLEIDEESLHRHKKRASKFDISFRTLESGDRLLVNLEYCTRLFKPETIDKIVGYLKRITVSVIENPDRKIDEIEIISPEKKKKILFHFNRELRNQGGAGKFQHKLFESFYNYADKIAVEYGTHEITYSQLKKRSGLISRWLIHHGLNQGSFIGVYLDNRIDTITAMLGILEARCIFVPLDTTLPSGRIQHIIRLIDLTVIFTGAAHKEKISTCGKDAAQQSNVVDVQPSFYQECAVLLPIKERLDYEEDDRIYVYFTSGSTGTPRAIMGSNCSLLHFINWEIATFGVTAGSRVSQLAAVGFDAFLRNVFTPLCAGGVVCIPENRHLVMDSKGLVDWINRCHIQLIHCIPGVFRLLNSALPTAVHFKNLKFILLSGDVVNPHDLENWYHIFNDRIGLINCYGATETTVIKTYYPIQKSDTQKDRIPVGKPIKGAAAIILDKNLNVCDEGMVGEIYMRTPYSTWGYCNDSQSNKEKFIPNPFSSDPADLVYRTGDLGRLLEDGNIEFTGRKDRQVKIRGVRIELGEVEKHLLRHPWIEETAVVVKKGMEISSGTSADREGENFLCAYFISPRKLSGSGLRDYLSQGLPNYMIPSYFTQIEKMPLTPSGKVNIHRLPLPMVGTSGRNYLHPRDKIEKTMAEVWSQVLGLDKEIIGIDDDFFELGGNSLNATMIAVRIHQLTNVKIPLSEIFKTPRVRKLSQYIKDTDKMKYASVTPVEKKEHYPVSSAQKRLYVLHQMEEAPTVYNMPIALESEGFLDKDRLEDTFLKLIDRHEVLRTSFFMLSDQPVHKIHKDVSFKIEYPGSDFIRPFDLSKAPLMRVGITDLEGQKHLLMIDMHHIITDGVSDDILVKDFMSLYGEEIPAPLRIQYKDYSQWQNKKSTRASLKDQEIYWIKEFAEEIPVLELPLDYPRPVLQSFKGKRIRFQMGSEETDRLKKYSREQGVTLYMTLLALYTIFLSKITAVGSGTIIVGTPVAGRRHVDLESIIGMFVNMLVLKNNPEGEKTFNEFLLEVKARTLQAFENQDYPYEELVEAVQVKRDTSRNPLFDTMFVFQNMDIVEAKIPGLELRPYPYENKTSKFDLSLSGWEAGSELAFQLEYCKKLFKQKTIQRFIEYFKNTISSAQANPAGRISSIEIVPEYEKKQILYDFNDTASGYPKNKTVHELFEEQAQKNPDALAVIGLAMGERARSTAKKGHPDSASLAQLTYKELNEKSTRLGGILRERGGAYHSIVAIVSERSLEMIQGILGILKSGGVYLPISPEYPQERKAYILRDSGAEVLLTTRSLFEEVEKLRCLEVETIFIEDIGRREEARGSRGKQCRGESITAQSAKRIAHSESYQEPCPAPCALRSASPSENLAYIIYTSGSTGTPKGVIIEHPSLINRLHWMQNQYPLDQSDTILQKTSVTFDVSVWELFWWSIIGAKLCLLKPGGEKDPGIITDTIEKYGVTIIHFVPSMLSAFLEYLRISGNIKKVATIRQVFSSGEELTSRQVQSFSESLYNHNSTQLANLYGPTEAAIDVSYFNCFIGKGLETIPIGKPINNIQLYILDKYGNPLPIGITGELFISGDGVGRGYLNRPELTAEKFKRAVISHSSLVIRSSKRLSKSTNDSSSSLSPNDPYPMTNDSSSSLSPNDRLYHTGDLARWLPDGNIRFIGRIDHQIKLKGYRIELGEIENRLCCHKHIKESVVLALEDESGDKYLCAYILPAPGMVPESSQLRDFLSDGLPHYMIPAFFVMLKALPLTSSGKVDRKALPRPEAGWQSDQDYVEPGNETEAKLMEIWRNVLIGEKIGTKDVFFNVGGDSIKAIRLLNKINEAFNAHLKVADLFRNPTIKKLSLKINKNRGEGKFEQDLAETYVDIEHLKNRTLSGENQNRIDNALIEDIFPMSDIEKGMVFYYLKDSQNALYHDQFVYQQTYSGFELAAFKKALQFVVEKHPILRTSFNIEDFEEPIHIIHKSIPVNPVVTDISSFDKSGKETYINDMIIKDRNTPFNIFKPPLWRMMVFLLDKDNICVVWVFHHAILDGWSNASLITEINNTYLRLKKEPDYTPNKLKSTYKDFVVEQIVEKKREKNIEFWKSELQDYRRLDFSGLGNRGVNNQKIIAIDKGKNYLETLRTAIDVYNVGIQDLCFSAYVCVMSMLAFDNDVIVGLITNNRPIIEDGDKILGCFLNTLPVRVKIPHHINWLDYIDIVNEKLKEVKEHGRVPFFEILRIIGEKTRENNPIFDTIFNFIDFHIFDQAKDDEDPGETSRDSASKLSLAGGYENTNTLLDFNISTTFGSLTIRVVYSNQLISDENAWKLVHYFERIIEKIINSPGSCIRKEDFITVEERQLLLYHLNNTDANYPGNKTLPELFEEQVEKNPDFTAVTFKYSQLTYRVLAENSNRLGRLLQEKGVARNTVVSIMLNRSLEMIVGIIGILKAGGAYLPISPEYPQERKGYILRDSGAKVLLTSRSFAEEVEKLRNLEVETIIIEDIGSRQEAVGIREKQCRGESMYSPDLSDQERRGEPCVRPQKIRSEPCAMRSASSPDNLAYVIYTSGTTGKPKGVLIDHGNVVRLLFNDRNLFDFSSKDIWTMFHSYCFDFSVWEMYGALLYGGKLVVVDGFVARDTRLYWQVLQKEKVTVLNQTPSAFYNLIEVTLNQAGGETSLRYVIFGGEALNPVRLKEWAARYPGIKLINMFGITETTVHVTYKEIGKKEIGINVSNIGRPIPTLNTYIIDSQLNLLPLGVAGELSVGGAGVGRGYLNRPELTEEKFIESPYKPGERLYMSGDLARLLFNGEMEYLGRIDHQVKIRGFRIELGEIENRILNHEDVKEAVVLTKEFHDRGNDDTVNKYLCAYVVLHSTSRSCTPASLKQYLSDLLPDYMIPSYVVILDEIPLTLNGKVDRKALPEPEIDTGEECIPPRNELEKGLVYILSEILGIDAVKISVRANLFEIGVDSIMLLKVANRISREFNNHFSIGTLFRNPTVEDLVAEMHKNFIPRDLKRLVLLNRGIAHKNLFLLSGDGTVYGMKDLARLLENDYNVYGFQARGIMDNGELPESRQGLLEEYYNEIKIIQPEGPYLIAGHCFGAIIAYELVRILEDRKNQVDKLIFFDMYAPIPEHILDHFKRYQVTFRLKNMFKMKKSKRGDKTNIVVNSNDESSTLPEDLEARRKEVQENFKRLFNNPLLIPRIIDTPLLVYKAFQPAEPNSPRWHPRVLGKISKQTVEIVDTPGDHDSMFELPHVSTLVRLLLDKN